MYGRIVLNISDFDVNVTANDSSRILIEDTEEGDAAGVRFFQKLHIYSENIPAWNTKL